MTPEEVLLAALQARFPESWEVRWADFQEAQSALRDVVGPVDERERRRWERVGEREARRDAWQADHAAAMEAHRLAAWETRERRRTAWEAREPARVRALWDEAQRRRDAWRRERVAAIEAAAAALRAEQEAWRRAMSARRGGGEDGER